MDKFSNDSFRNNIPLQTLSMAQYFSSLSLLSQSHMGTNFCPRRVYFSKKGNLSSACSKMSRILTPSLLLQLPPPPVIPKLASAGQMDLQQEKPFRHLVVAEVFNPSHGATDPSQSHASCQPLSVT
jgi:hypothetical protein